MKYGGKYWDIRKYPPYQRCFNFINSERSIGKTYTTQGFFLEQAIKKAREFVYIVRTQDEQKKGVFGKAFEKVVRNEFKEYNFEFTKTECFLVIENENGDVVEKTPLGYCIALSEATKNKKINYPNVKWLMFDEYIVDEKEKVCMLMDGMSLNCSSKFITRLIVNEIMSFVFYLLIISLSIIHIICTRLLGFQKRKRMLFGNRKMSCFIGLVPLLN